MPYNIQYNTELLDINQHLRARDLSIALTKFKAHLKGVVSIGRFSIKEWNTDWRKSVYRFGEEFIDINPIDFLNAIKDERRLINSDKDKEEVLDFYQSEIDYNTICPTDVFHKVEEYKKKYSYNPEFHNSLGHLLKKKELFEDAIQHYQFALSKDKSNGDYRASMFDAYLKYFETLLEDEKYHKGLELAEKLLKDKVFKYQVYDNTYQIVLIGVRDRFKDVISMNERIKKAENEIKEIVNKESNRGQFKVIEILGFFSAIMAFIFSTVSIGKNFSYQEAILFNISLGLTLIIFAMSISLVFNKKKEVKYKLHIIIVAVLGLLLLAIKTGIN